MTAIRVLLADDHAPNRADVRQAIEQDPGLAVCAVDLFGALRAGADGYLLKDMDPARIPNAIRDAFEGKGALPRALTSRLIEEFRDTAPRWRSVSALNGPSRLTSREWEIVALLRRGRSTRQIARRLLLSPATVRSHIAAAVRKLGATDRDDLIRRLDEDARHGEDEAAES